MKTNWPQIVWCMLAAFHWAYVAVNHGEPDERVHSFPVTTVCIAFTAWLLWCGGFFG